MAATWYLAPSLVRLRDEVNARWPARDKASDGAIGDPAHAARHSEHNPDAKGCVHAIDIDKDGVDPALILARCIAHPATWYVIWNRHIYRRKVGFKAEAYTGDDPHTGHLHVSITLSAAAETSAAPWGIKEDDMLTAADLDAIEERSHAGVRAYFTAGPDFRDLGDGAQSPPLRLLQKAAEHAYATRGAVGVLAGVVAQLDQNGDLDPTELARQIVALLPDDIAKQVLDGLAQRLTETETAPAV